MVGLFGETNLRIPMLHDFQESLKRSHEQEDAEWWEFVYRSAFPSFATMYSTRSDGWWQRAGIDRVVLLKNSKQITIDEKVRLKDWGDIALERWSDRDRKVPGWIQKNLACDYIAYAFIPSQRCYLFPFLSLRRVWIDYGHEWIKQAEQQNNGFRVVEAKNKRYVTESIAVPIEALQEAINQSMIVDWKQ